MYKVTVSKTFNLNDAQPTLDADVDKQMTAEVRASLKLPFVPYPNLDLRNVGTVESVEFDTESGEFFIRVKDEKITTCSKATLRKNFNSQLDYFTQTVCESWENAFVEVRCEGTRYRYWVKDGNIHTRET